MTKSSVEQHQEAAHSKGSVAVGLVTVSDTRTPETDVNGQYLREQLAAAGHTVVAYRIVRDEPAEVREVLDATIAAGAQVVLFNGGTGIAKRDTTIDVLQQCLEKEMPGFGEIFRVLSYDQVGAAAMLSRATAGLYRGAVVFATPGSHKAVQLAWEKLLGPELAHVAWELTR
ncbi:MAG: molybdenum cofactor biosynthesis protein MoaB [Candidatus Hydrogenedentes bacterium]|nr:molybdenum cofactor biosynthesis protein MoaB [Candidatus Hydrogenedentota bacterium]